MDGFFRPLLALVAVSSVLPILPVVQQVTAGLEPGGVPIFVGPATLSLLLVLAEVHGSLPVIVALAVNAAINGGFVAMGDRLLGLVGEGASRAIGKVMSLVLATLGAGMLRAGIAGALGA